MKKKTLALAALLGLGQLTCHQALFTAPPGSVIFLSANPLDIPAHGGVSVVSALVVEEPGTVVPDGTVVQFFTNLGRIQEQGRTNDGVARVNLTSDARSGIATVSAISGAAQVDADLSIRIGAVLPARVIVTASPPRIVLSVSRTAHVIATVLDDNGNPVPNVPVIFRVSTPATEFMESGGRPVFTDNNGRAEDVVRTQRPVGSPPGNITVEVVVLSADPLTVGNTVTIPVL
jgi:hypothetical protein